MAIRKPTVGSGAKTPYAPAKRPPLQSTAMPGKPRPPMATAPLQRPPLHSTALPGKPKAKGR